MAARALAHRARSSAPWRRALRLAPWWLLAALVLGCGGPGHRTGMVSHRIGQAVRAPGATEIDLGKLTTFGWTYFYASAPGATREEICTLIGAPRVACGQLVRTARAPDDHVFLLFGLNGALTHIELHDVANGRFAMAFPKGGHPRSRSVFTVRHAAGADGRDQIILEPR